MKPFLGFIQIKNNFYASPCLAITPVIMLASLFSLLTFSCNGAYSKQAAIPLNVVASGSSLDARDNSVEINWEASENGEVYYIYRGEDVEPQQNVDFYIGSSVALSYIDNTALEELVDYHYKVSSANLYGDKESSLSETAVGWIKRRVWILKDSVADSVVELNGTVDLTGSYYYLVYRNALNEIRAGRISWEREEPEEEAVDDASLEPDEEVVSDLILWKYNLDWYPYSLGNAADVSAGASFDILLAGGALYIAFADRDESGAMTVKALTATVETDEETSVESIEWTLEKIGSLGFTGLAISHPRLTSTLKSGLPFLTVGWSEAGTPPDVKMSQYWIDNHLAWSPVDCSDLTSALALTTEPTSAETLKVIPVYSGFTLSAAIIKEDEPWFAFYQQNFAETAWTAVGDPLIPVAASLSGVDIVNNGGRFFALLNQNQTLKAYVYDDQWLSISTGFDTVDVSSGWDFESGPMLFYRDSSDFLRVKLYDYEDGEWATATWIDRGRYSVDASVEGVVDLEAASYLQIAPAGVLNFASWISSAGQLEWAVLE